MTRWPAEVAGTMGNGGPTDVPRSTTWRSNARSGEMARRCSMTAMRRGDVRTAVSASAAMPPSAAPAFLRLCREGECDHCEQDHRDANDKHGTTPNHASRKQ